MPYSGKLTRNNRVRNWLNVRVPIAPSSFCLGFIPALPALSEEMYFNLRVPHPFTSQDGGETRCFEAVRCYGPPEGGWAWQAEDVGKFDASAPLPLFDYNRPQPYRSKDGGQTRCFVGYRCYGPPPGGWLWPAQQAMWYQNVWSWIRDAVVPWIRDVGFPATNEALEQGLPEKYSTPLAVVDTSIAITQSLQTIEKGNAQIMEQVIDGLCSKQAMTCTKNDLVQAAEELSNKSFMGKGYLSTRTPSVAKMSPAQYQSYVRSVVIEWVKQAGYTVQ